VKPAPRILLYLYVTTLFVSAALLFLVQPMVARMILPFFGGTPAVWNTCLFFFQASLLAGYLYAHVGSLRLGLKRHLIIHLAMIVAAVFILPVSLPKNWIVTADVSAVKLVLWVLWLSVGFPFIVLSATSPLLQKWFSRTSHVHARDPYFLYAASNLGSIAGLLAYPVFFEPYFRLPDQSLLWFYGYILFSALIIVCGVGLLVFSFGIPVEEKSTSSPDIPFAPGAWQADSLPTVARRLRWVALSFVPSSLLLGVSTYITTDLASVPLFWIVPLILYLLSFVLGFSRFFGSWHAFVVRRQGFLLVAAAITLFVNATSPSLILIPLHLLAFFVTALVCAGELAKDRPSTLHLTEFYLWISFGGVLGGFFNALLAPVIFQGLQEYPLAMVAAALLRPNLQVKSNKGAARSLDVMLPAFLGLLISGLIVFLQERDWFGAHINQIIIFGLAGVIGLSFAARPIRFGLGLVAVMVASGFYTGPYRALFNTGRSFFGIYRIMLDESERYHLLFHGTTLHGIQSVEEERRLEPLAYYYPTGPVGQVFKELTKTGFNGRVGIVGLGSGSMACYGAPGQPFTFYEIDPLVAQIARDSRWFTYLRDCPARVNIVLGDARLSLAEAPDAYYGLFVLDAFSSDAIPTHLLTQEAVGLYLSKLAPGGILLFHISNRHFNLAPVLARLASSANLKALIREDVNISESEMRLGKEPSRWVVMARATASLGPYVGDPHWQWLTVSADGEVWTDDYTNIWQVLVK
jgi:hypothetical protein